MNVIAPRKYNPGFLSDDELVASFCVRTGEFESVMEVLRECTGHSNTHQIVIGPRGSGKTSLLLRVAAELRRDAALSSAFFPVVFAEESYEIATAGQFWLECLSRLADRAPRREGDPDLRRSYEDLRAIRDDRTLGERCLGALLDFSDRENKRLVLAVENLNMMFRDMTDPDTGWRLRKVLQTEPRIVLLASATSRFDEIDNPEHALYDQFRTLTLRPLDTKECAVLWEAASGRSAPAGTIRSLEILTGGSPRLLAIVARFGAGRSFRDLMADLLDLIDDHTEYFKSHLESLPAQERRVYLALADLWKPALTREIADRARLDTSKCSAWLSRLVERGVVQVEGGSARRKQYYLSERLYNIYYLLRRRGGTDSLVEALIRFMASFYSPRELTDIGAGIAREARELGTKMRALHRSAFARLMELPVLAGDREELLAMAPPGFAGVLAPSMAELDRDQAGKPGADRGERAEATAAQALFNKAVALHNRERAKEALAAYNELASRFAASGTPLVLDLIARALVNRGNLLVRMKRQEDALVSWDEVVLRFGESRHPTLLKAVATALGNKGGALHELDRPEEALAACDEVVRRFGESRIPALLEVVAWALVNRGSLFAQINRKEDALVSWEEVVRRFGENQTPTLFEAVATALGNTGNALRELDRPEDALVACNEVVRRFGESRIPALLEVVANALGNKGIVLNLLNRPKEALAACDEVVRRFGESRTPALLHVVAGALGNKGISLNRLNRREEALAAYDEIVRRFGESRTPALLEVVANALGNGGSLLAEMNREEEALVSWDEIVRRFGKSRTPALLKAVAKTLGNKGIMLNMLNRHGEALTACDEVVRRFGKSRSPVFTETVAKALGNKGNALCGLNRPEEALAAYDEAVQRFGKDQTPAVLESVAKILGNKGIVLNMLNRPEEALVACNEVVHRFGESQDPAVLATVGTALVNKGIALDTLNRPKEASSAYDEATRRFGENESPMLQTMIGFAFVRKAELELERGRYEAAIEAATRALDRNFTDLPAYWRSHLARAKAGLAAGNPTVYERDIEAMLAILPKIAPLPTESMDALVEFATGVGAKRMRELIQASPAADLLLPLTTALEWELGLKPRVAREVEEVAGDIRRCLEEPREARADGVG